MGKVCSLSRPVQAAWRGAIEPTNPAGRHAGPSVPVRPPQRSIGRPIKPQMAAKDRPRRLPGVPTPVGRRRSSPRLQPAAWMSTHLWTFARPRTRTCRCPRLHTGAQPGAPPVPHGGAEDAGRALRADADGSFATPSAQCASPAASPPFVVLPAVVTPLRLRYVTANSRLRERLVAVVALGGDRLLDAPPFPEASLQRPLKHPARLPQGGCPSPGRPRARTCGPGASARPTFSRSSRPGPAETAVRRLLVLPRPVAPCAAASQFPTPPPDAAQTPRTMPPGSAGVMLCSAALVSSVIASTPTVFPRARPAAANRSSTRVHTAACVSTSIRRRVRDSIAWFGAASVASRSRNDRRLSASAPRRAIPRSNVSPSQ